MFGYVKPDFPNLYMKDNNLFNALYCGACKSMGKACGQCSRFSLTFDIAFLSAVVHNLLGEDVTIERKHCAIHWFTKRPIAKPDEISEILGCLNVILAYYKIKDDILDSGKGRIASLFFKPSFNRAKKRCPDFENIVKEKYEELYKLEKSECKSVDMVAHPFSEMLAKIGNQLIKDKATESSYNFFYNFGKWIYLIDALDDYDKDIKKKNYNPFYEAYNKPDYSTLKKECGEEISFIMSATLDGIGSSLKDLRFNFNGDLIRNVSLRGTVETTKKILLKESVKKK